MISAPVSYVARTIMQRTVNFSYLSRMSAISLTVSHFRTSHHTPALVHHSFLAVPDYQLNFVQVTGSAAVVRRLLRNIS